MVITYNDISKDGGTLKNMKKCECFSWMLRLKSYGNLLGLQVQSGIIILKSFKIRLKIR